MYLTKKRKKYSYLLLELLIGIFLLTIFLTPMLQGSYSYLKKQKKEILSLRLGLEADKMLIAIEEELRKGQVPWETLVASQKEKILIENFSIKKSFDSRLPTISSRLFLSKGKLKKLQNGTTIGTVVATVEFTTSARQNKVIYTLSSLFFVTKKKWEHTPSSSFPNVKDTICQATL